MTEMEEAKEAERAGAPVKKKKRTTVDAYIDPKIIIPIPSEERARLYREKHAEVLTKSVRLSAVIKWYADRQGQNFPPAVLSALRQPSVTHDDAEKKAEEQEQEAEEEEDEEQINENYSDAI